MAKCLQNLTVKHAALLLPVLLIAAFEPISAQATSEQVTAPPTVKISKWRAGISVGKNNAERIKRHFDTAFNDQGYSSRYSEEGSILFFPYLILRDYPRIHGNGVQLSVFTDYSVSPYWALGLSYNYFHGIKAIGFKHLYTEEEVGSRKITKGHYATFEHKITETILKISITTKNQKLLFSCGPSLIRQLTGLDWERDLPRTQFGFVTSAEGRLYGRRRGRVFGQVSLEYHFMPRFRLSSLNYSAQYQGVEYVSTFSGLTINPSYFSVSVGVGVVLN